mgnify:CR=1 FL=1|tara:strand:- start:1712 stop:2311 length:600 start_codon:yes stop_codon:yes gene_type:complete
MSSQDAGRIAKKSTWGGRFKKGLKIAVAGAGAYLGYKGYQQFKQTGKDELSAHLAGISTLQTPSGLAGFSSEGVMSGTQKPAQGLQGAVSGIFRGGGQALDTTPAGSGASQGIQQAITSGAGILSGQTSVGQGIRDVAGAVFEGRKDPTAQQIASAGAGAKAGATVVAGAEGISATNRELLGQLAGKFKPKRPKLKFGG